MLKFVVTFTERHAGAAGPARKVDVHFKAEGNATTAEYELAEHWKPLIEQIMNAKVVDRSEPRNKTEN